MELDKEPSPQNVTNTSEELEDKGKLNFFPVLPRVKVVFFLNQSKPGGMGR